MRRENELLMLAVLQNRTQLEEKRLKKLLELKNDWSYISGQAIHHRLSGYLYYGLGKDNRKRLSPEYLQALKVITTLNEKIYFERYSFLKKVFDELDESGVRYSGLKGMIYPIRIYPFGIRYSDDWDILVCEDDLDILDKVLISNGYIQSFDGGKSVASRKQILIQRLNYHDLVPYCKRIGNGIQEYIKLDINIHFDNKDNDITRDIIMEGTEVYEKNSFALRGLKSSTHFLHLCVHFFREASNTIWTKGKRDVSIYKIIDIICTYRNLNENDLAECYQYAERFNLKQQLYFTLNCINKFYNNEIQEELLERLNLNDFEFLDDIFVEGEHRSIKRTEDFYDRAFNLVY